MPQSVEQLAADLVKAATCWVPAPAKALNLYPGTFITSVALPDGRILALLKYPDPATAPISAKPVETTGYHTPYPPTSKPPATPEVQSIPCVLPPAAPAGREQRVVGGP